MKISITDKWAVMVKDDTLVQNSKKNYVVEFDFDESWEGFAKTAIFEAGTSNIAVVLSEDRCTIPPECLKQAGVMLRIGVYGVKGGERKATVWCLASRIIYDVSLSTGLRPPSAQPNCCYSEIMGVIGDLSAAGFEGRTLTEVIVEIRNSVSETATDQEVDKMLTDTFGQKTDPPDRPEDGCDNTATDKEVADILNDVFGEQP